MLEEACCFLECFLKEETGFVHGLTFNSRIQIVSDGGSAAAMKGAGELPVAETLSRTRSIFSCLSE